MSRYQFTPSPLTSATAASQAKYEADGIFSILKMRVDAIRDIGNFTARSFDRADKDGYSLRVYVESGSYFIEVFSATQGFLGIGSRLISELPADGNDIAIYVAASPAGLAIAVGAADGTVIHSGTNATGAWAGGAGTGNVNLGPTADGPMLEVDCYARLSGARAGDARFAKPLTSDGDVLGVYYYSEGSGATVADDEGGTALTLTNGAWLTGGTWEGTAFDPPVFTELDVSNPNESYEIGVLLDPILVTKLDQYGDPISSGPTDVSVASLDLLVDVTGTLTEAFVGPVATFDNLTPVGEEGGLLTNVTLGGTVAGAAAAGVRAFSNITLTAT